LRPRDLLDLIAPPQCLSCARPAPVPLCPTCENVAPWREAGDRDPPAGSGLAACTTLLWLEGPVSEWIHRAKYPGAGPMGLDPGGRGLLAELARRLGDRISPAAGDLVVPIPLHPRRLAARGFNQAALLATHAFARSRARLAGNVLVRIRDTPSQTGLDRAARLTNVRGAFACRPVAPWPPTRVWIVDDVITTGATLAEAGRALREAGARNLIGVGLARARIGGRSDPVRGEAVRVGRPWGESFT